MTSRSFAIPLLLLALLLLALLGGCAGGAGDDAAERLRGGEWIVEDIGGRGIIDASRVTLNFGGDGRLSGQATCNGYTAPYEAQGQSLTIGRAITTLRACVPALNRQERAFLELLSAVRGFRFSDTGALILENATGATITARR